MLLSENDKKLLARRVSFRKPTYFLGYGSLMFPWGIEGRGLKKKYTQEEMKPVMLKGFQRSFFAKFPAALESYYGLIQNPKSSCNAVIFEIETRKDLSALLLNESAHPAQKYRLYEPMNVAKFVDADLPTNAKVIALLNPGAQDWKEFANPRYVRYVFSGISIWGEDFVKKFLETGGLQNTRETTFSRFFRFSF